MNYPSLQYALAIHCAVLLFVHIAICYALVYFDKFNWLSTGFWIWAASLCVFVLHPLVALLSGDLSMYIDRLSNTDGADRVYWILLCLVIGLVLIFMSYLFSSEGRPSVTDRGYKHRGSETAVTTILLFFFILALYGIFAFRINTRAIETGDVGIDGKFSGDVSGWGTAIHRFALVPIVFFFMRRKTLVLGSVCLCSYTAMRIFDPDDRLTVVTPFIAIIAVYLAANGKKWPSLWMAGAASLFLVALVIKGHSKIDELGHDITVHDDDNIIKQVLSGGDSDMLSQFYKQSDLHDTHGYTYGLTFVQSALFGYLPRIYFPWKDSLFDDLIFDPYSSPKWCKYIAGPKSTIIGYFYYYGALPAIVLLCPVFGFVSRRVDGMTKVDRPLLIRSVGFNFLSLIFSFFMGSPEWILQYVFLISMPAMLCVLALKLFEGTESEVSKHPNLRFALSPSFTSRHTQQGHRIESSPAHGTPVT